MGGDGQMDPDQMSKLLDPIVDGVAETAETITADANAVSETAQEQSETITDISESASTVAQRARSLRDQLDSFTLSGQQAESRTGLTSPQ